MARRVPTSCTQFLGEVATTFQQMVAKRPELQRTVKALRTVGGHALAIQHPMAKDLRWTFRSVDADPGQMEFNVECKPRANLGIDASALARAMEEVELRGTVRIEGDKLVCSLPWGHESQAHELTEGGLLANNLREFAVDGMLAMIRLLERYGQRPVVRTAEELDNQSVAREARPVTERLRLTLESYLEDLIIEQWSDIDFGTDLEFVERQVECGNIGTLDILARDRNTDGYVVIELKRDQGDDETFGQLSRYMGWIAENKDQPEDVPVSGIIVAAEITLKLEAAAKTNPGVRLVEYAIKLELLPKEEEHGSSGSSQRTTR